MKKWLLALSAVFLLAGCGQQGGKDQTAKDTKDVKKVSVVLDWTPNTNHTGLYVAKEKGFFQKHGLDVTILQPGESGPNQLVASGKAQFGISSQEEVTQARAQGIPLVSIAAVIQHNTSGFASPVAKHIQSPKDFEGKTYGSWGSPVEKAVIQSIMQLQKADVNKVKFLNIGNTDFLTAVKRDVDFAWIFYGWEGIDAELKGEKLNMLYLKDFSKKLDYYTPVIITNEKLIQTQPDIAKKFMAAVSEGYTYAIDHPKEAANLLLKGAPDLDKKLVMKSQEWLSPRYQDDAPRWGEQKKEVWENYADWMYDHHVLDKRIDVQKAFTNQFLPNPKGGEK
ncbi:ABC transporter substrate-binding protein [Bacillus smithii]|uniref:ABC transporter substrate-binding protein n=1 Tax=Bacillus smithii TaxID=1479 RepID=UPI002E1AD73E|nr:ABC transporter substrate-binding protein [Bacillus smithii]